MQVLFIEDDDAVRETFATLLREASLTVSEEKFAEDGLRALTRGRPDVILLDLGMPVGHMSGIEMLARLRQVPQWVRIPVVVFSGFGDTVNPDVMARLNVSYLLSKAGVRGNELARLLRDLATSSARSSAAERR